MIVLNKIGDKAFKNVGSKNKYFQGLVIPSVGVIGNEAFMNVGRESTEMAIANLFLSHTRIIGKRAFANVFQVSK